MLLRCWDDELFYELFALHCCFCFGKQLPVAPLRKDGNKLRKRIKQDPPLPCSTCQALLLLVVTALIVVVCPPSPTPPAVNLSVGRLISLHYDEELFRFLLSLSETLDSLSLITWSGINMLLIRRPEAKLGRESFICKFHSSSPTRPFLVPWARI